MKTRPGGRADFFTLYIYYFKFEGVDRQSWEKYIWRGWSELGEKSEFGGLDKVWGRLWAQRDPLVAVFWNQRLRRGSGQVFEIKGVTGKVFIFV